MVPFVEDIHRVTKERFKEYENISEAKRPHKEDKRVRRLKEHEYGGGDCYVENETRMFDSGGLASQQGVSKTELTITQDQEANFDILLGATYVQDEVGDGRQVAVEIIRKVPLGTQHGCSRLFKTVSWITSICWMKSQTSATSRTQATAARNEPRKCKKCDE